MVRGKQITDKERESIHRMAADGVVGRRIAQLLGISKTCVYRILRDGPGKKVTNKRGPKPSVSARIERRVVAEIRKRPRVGLGKIAALFVNEVSESTVRRIVAARGMTRKKATRRPVLREQHRSARLEFGFWLLRNNDVIDQIVWTDEKRFLLDGPDGYTYAWAEPDREAQGDQAKADPYGKRGIMVHLAMSAGGVISVERLHSPVTGRSYADFLSNTLLPRIRARFSGDFLFQHDNAPPHRARITRVRFEEEGVVPISWPPYSPDLNPVENLWALISSKVYRASVYFENEELLWESVRRATIAVPEEICRNLVNSLPDRVEAAARNGWGYAK